MRLKEIKEGMIIHCKTLEEAKKLNLCSPCGNKIEEFVSTPCYIEIGNVENKIGYFAWSQDINQFVKPYELVEFSDLIIEEEMSAEEMIEWLKCGCMDDRFADVFHCNINADICGVIDNYSSKEIVKRAIEWKADHEKKEPEVEWLWKAYIVGSVYDYYDAETVDEAIKWCEDRVKRFPEVKCTYKRVCRVKGGANER